MTGVWSATVWVLGCALCLKLYCQERAGAGMHCPLPGHLEKASCGAHGSGFGFRSGDGAGELPVPGRGWSEDRKPARAGNSEDLETGHLLCRCSAGLAFHKAQLQKLRDLSLPSTLQAFAGIGTSFSFGGARTKGVLKQKCIWKGGHGSTSKFNPFKSWGAPRERGPVGEKRDRKNERWIGKQG